MRDVVTAFILFAAFAGLFVYNSYAVNSCNDDVEKHIIAAELSIRDKDLSAVEDNTKKAADTWSKRRKMLMYVYNHSHIDRIDIALFETMQYVRSGNYERAMFMMEESRFFLADLKNHEKITMDNIF